MSDSNQHAGFSFQISDTPPPTRRTEGTQLAELDLDMGDFGTPVDESKARPAAAIAAAVAPPVAPASAWLDPPAKSEDLPPKLASAAPPAAPKIKKISFPRGKKSSSSGSSRSVSPTKFSRSISAQGPRRLDSDPDAEMGSPAFELAPPEDLPSEEHGFHAEGTEPPGWGTDTPSARAIWRKARESWHVASKKAAVLGGQGVRASVALAESMNEKLRQKLRESAENERLSEQQPLPEHPGAESVPRGPGPSVAGRVILGLARSTGRKVAAPLSAIAAACVVYFVGSHFLGTDGAMALSKAVKGPEVPELGSLEEPRGHASAKSPEKEKARAVGDKATESANKPTLPKAMQTEITDMPEGMSWPGKGLIEVVTSTDELVYVDGVFTGRGPLRRIPVSPGDHEISIRTEGSERKGTVQVQANKSTRAVFEGQ